MVFVIVTTPCDECWANLAQNTCWHLVETLLSLAFNNMTIALLPSSKRWDIRNFMLVVMWIVEFWALSICITSTLISYLTILKVSLQVTFLTRWCGCLYGCKLKWCPCFLGGRNIFKHHMYLHTYEFSCNSYMPRWTLRGGQLWKEVVK
jgi:hypothetical protein